MNVKGRDGGMQSVIGGALLPHPPIVVPDVGGDQLNRVADTARAMREAAGRIRGLALDVLVVVTPHGPVTSRGVAVSSWPEMVGDLAAFGAPGAAVSFRGDVRLGRDIVSSLERAGMDAVLEDRPDPAGMDHGSVVPLWYLAEAGVDARLVLISGVRCAPPSAAEIGGVLAGSLAGAGARAMVVASGDLSHRLTPGAPGGYDPAGERFDRELIDHLARGDTDGLLTMDQGLVRDAGECGLNPLCLTIGAMGSGWTARVLSYEGPFGVGYGVADLYPETRRGEMYADLARASLEYHLDHGEPYPVGPVLSPELARRTGCFVTIRRHGELRGCIGTVEPQRENLAEEISANAVSAGTRDPRFKPLGRAELPSLDVSVDVLGVAEPVDGEDQLDPERYGVIVEKGGRRGLLLPALDGIDTVEKQLSIAMSKAGLSPGESGVTLYRFEVERHSPGTGGT